MEKIKFSDLTSTQVLNIVKLDPLVIKTKGPALGIISHGKVSRGKDGNMTVVEQVVAPYGNVLNADHDVVWELNNSGKIVLLDKNGPRFTDCYQIIAIYSVKELEKCIIITDYEVCDYEKKSISAKDIDFRDYYDGEMRDTEFTRYLRKSSSDGAPSDDLVKYLTSEGYSTWDVEYEFSSFENSKEHRGITIPRFPTYSSQMRNKVDEFKRLVSRDSSLRLMTIYGQRRDEWRSLVSEIKTRHGYIDLLEKKKFISISRDDVTDRLVEARKCIDGPAVNDIKFHIEFDPEKDLIEYGMYIRSEQNVSYNIHESSDGYRPSGTYDGTDFVWGSYDKKEVKISEIDFDNLDPVLSDYAEELVSKVDTILFNLNERKVLSVEYDNVYESIRVCEREIECLCEEFFKDPEGIYEASTWRDSLITEELISINDKSTVLLGNIVVSCIDKYRADNGDFVHFHCQAWKDDTHPYLFEYSSNKLMYTSIDVQSIKEQRERSYGLMKFFCGD